jgi:hypothetical protein
MRQGDTLAEWWRRWTKSESLRYEPPLEEITDFHIPSLCSCSKTRHEHIRLTNDRLVIEELLKRMPGQDSAEAIGPE